MSSAARLGLDHQQLHFAPNPRFSRRADPLRLRGGLCAKARRASVCERPKRDGPISTARRRRSAFWSEKLPSAAASASAILNASVKRKLSLFRSMFAAAQRAQKEASTFFGGGSRRVMPCTLHRPKGKSASVTRGAPPDLLAG